MRAREIGSTRLHSNGHGETYRQIKTEAGWKYEHRVVAEEKIGRPIRRDEDVHHENFVPLDNRPGNLTVLNHTAHADWHLRLAEAACI